MSSGHSPLLVAGAVEEDEQQPEPDARRPRRTSSDDRQRVGRSAVAAARPLTERHRDEREDDPAERATPTGRSPRATPTVTGTTALTTAVIGATTVIAPLARA